MMDDTSRPDLQQGVRAPVYDTPAQHAVMALTLVFVLLGGSAFVIYAVAAYAAATNCGGVGC